MFGALQNADENEFDTESTLLFDIPVNNVSNEFVNLKINIDLQLMRK
jgi:hypothetical protein